MKSLLAAFLLAPLTAAPQKSPDFTARYQGNVINYSRADGRPLDAAQIRKLIRFHYSGALNLIIIDGDWSWESGDHKVRITYFVKKKILSIQK